MSINRCKHGASSGTFCPECKNNLAPIFSVELGADTPKNSDNDQFNFWMNYIKMEVGAWASKTFPKANNKTILTHLRDEVKELSEASIRHGFYDYMDAQLGKDNIEQELADCFMLLLHFADRNKIDVGKAILRKFELVKQREYETEINEKGYFSHKVGE